MQSVIELGDDYHIVLDRTHMKILALGLQRYTCIVAAPQIATMRIVFEYTHLYIQIQTNINKNEMTCLFAALEINEIIPNQQR